MTHIVTVPGITSINFEAPSAVGVAHVFTDIESTVTEYGVKTVNSAVLQHLNAAREAGAIASLSLITNKTDKEFVASVAEQLEADQYLMPRDKSERKPSPAMIERGAEFLRVTAPQIAVIGDKLTADMKAAQRAGAAYGYWVTRLGRADHIGDRFFRRPYESLFRWRYDSHSSLALRHKIDPHAH